MSIPRSRDGSRVSSFRRGCGCFPFRRLTYSPVGADAHGVVLELEQNALIAPPKAEGASHVAMQREETLRKRWHYTQIPILAVRLLAVEHALDLEIIVMLAEKDPTVLGAQPDHGRSYAFDLLGRAFSGENVAAQGLENLDGDGLLDNANVGPGLLGPDDAFGH